jgi:hypothetical protein
MRTTNISLAGDREYVRRVRALALMRNVQIGELVRAALDEKYGADLRSIEDSFFAESGKSAYHMENEEKVG